jgi:hypothetical protein
MSDDDDRPTFDNVSNLVDNPAFKAKQSAHGAPKLDSRQAAIDWVDQNYAVTWIVGKFMIINERIEGEYSLMSKKDFIDSLENVRIVVTDEEKPKITPVSDLWLKWPLRRTYEKGIIFDPKNKFDSKTMKSGYYNTWPDFAMLPIKGKCDLFLKYLKTIICSNNEQHYNYLMSWISQIFQEPWNKLGTALVLRGLKGIGKSYLAKVLGMLIDGKDGVINKKSKLYLPIDNKNSIFGPHNDHLEKIILLCLEEAIWAGDKAHESTLKHIITGDTLFINPKNLPGRSVKNYMRSIIIGNADWLVPASYDERRFFVLNVNAEQKDIKEYFDALDFELLNGGLEALMYEFMNYDYSNVNLRTALITEAQIEQKAESMTGVEKWWFNLLNTGKLPFVKYYEDKGYYVIKEKLYIDFCSAQNRMSDRNRYNERSFGIKFKELLPMIENGQVKYAKNGRIVSIVGDDKYTSENERLNVYVIPSLVVCRALMNYRLRLDYDWPLDGGEWEFPTYTETDIMSKYRPF